MEKNYAKELIDRAGVDALMGLGLSLRNLRHMQTAGQFPAGWYLPVKEMMESRGLICPIEAFRFFEPNKKFGDDIDKFQEGQENEHAD